MKLVPYCLIILTHLFVISTTSSASPAAQKLNIAMILWRGETEAEKGFMDGLKALGYSVDYSQVNAEQDAKELGVLLHKISEEIERYDYIYTFGTTVSRRAKVVINNRVPQIFNAVTDPVGSGIVRSPQSPDSQIGGASDSIPSALQVKTMLEAMEIKRLGLFFNPREKNSMLIRDEFYKHARSNQFEIIDFRSPPVGNLLEENLQRILDDPALVDALYFPSDSFLASNAHYIGTKLKELKIASFGSVKEYIEGGILMGHVVDYIELGKAVAGIIDQHQKGLEFKNIPIAVPESYPLYINKRTMEFLNVQLSESLTRKGIFYH